MTVINIEKCNQCGQTINTRKITLYSGMVHSLAKVYGYCWDKRRRTFARREIKHMLSQNEFARFGDWIEFGLLQRNKKKGNFIMHMELTRDFLRGEEKIPTELYKRGKEKVSRHGWKYIYEVKGLVDFLDTDGSYIVEYYP